jgi:hypothetical protein
MATTSDAAATASERGLCESNEGFMRHAEKGLSVRGSLPLCGEFLIIAL